MATDRKTLSTIKKETRKGLFFRRLHDPPPSDKRIKVIIGTLTRFVNPYGSPFSAGDASLHSPHWDERGLPGRPLALYAARIVAAPAGKYYRTAGQLTGKRFRL